MLPLVARTITMWQMGAPDTASGAPVHVRQSFRGERVLADEVGLHLDGNGSGRLPTGPPEAGNAIVCVDPHQREAVRGCHEFRLPGRPHLAGYGMLRFVAPTSTIFIARLLRSAVGTWS